MKTSITAKEKATILLLGLFLCSYIAKGGESSDLSLWTTFIIFLAFSFSSILTIFAKTNKTRLKILSLDVLVLSSLFTFFFGTLTSNFSELSILFLTQFFTYAFLPYFLVRLSSFNTTTSYFFFCKTYPLICLASLAAMLFIIGPDNVFHNKRFGGPNVNPVGLASTLLSATLISLIYLLKSKRPHKSLGRLTVFIALAFALILTGSRGSILALAVGSFLITATTRAALLPSFFTLCALSFVALFFFVDTDYLYARLINLDGQSTSERLVLYEAAIEEISNSLIFGIGLGKFHELYGGYPHNIILDLVSSFGLLGIALLAAAFLFFAHYYRKAQFYNAAETKALLAVIVALVTVRMFSVNLANLKDLYIFLAILANVTLIYREKGLQEKRDGVTGFHVSDGK